MKTLICIIRMQECHLNLPVHKNDIGNASCSINQWDLTTASLESKGETKSENCREAEKESANQGLLLKPHLKSRISGTFSCFDQLTSIVSSGWLCGLQTK